MTRPEKIAKAKALRADGLTYQQIGDRLGVNITTGFKWLNPERVREYNQRDLARRRGCSGRGPRPVSALGVQGIGTRRVAERGHLIERLWAEGLLVREIAAQFGWSVNHTGVEMHRLRDKGFDLPLRRPPMTGNTNRRVAA